MTADGEGVATGTRVVYLLRHGRTALNASGRIRGRSDEPLDETGVMEIERLAGCLAGHTPGAIFTSPMARARQTAAIIAAATTGAVTVVPELRDRDYGQWDGALLAAVTTRFGRLDAADGVESEADLAVRIRDAFDRVVARAGDDVIVIVGHDATNRALLGALDRPPDPGRLPQPTGCWNRIERGAAAWMVTAIGRLPASENPA